MPKKSADSVADAIVDLIDQSEDQVDSTPGSTTEGGESVDDKLARMFDEANAPFDQTYQRQIDGGKVLTYITHEQALNRLREVYGPTWQWILNDPVPYQNSVLVTGTLTVSVDGVKVSRSGAGGNTIRTRSNSDIPLDIGNNFKSAESSAFKRAAAKFGVGARYYEKERDDTTQGQYTPSYTPRQAFTPPASQGNAVQFPQNNSTGDSTTGLVEAVSMPSVGPDGKQRLGGLKVQGQWYNVSQRAPFAPAIGMKGQVVTISHAPGKNFIDAVSFTGGQPVPSDGEDVPF